MKGSLTETLSKLNSRELRELCWEKVKQRPIAGLSIKEAEVILSIKDESVRENPVNNMRDTMIEFIEKNQFKLAVYCDGNCYNHPDEIVIGCYQDYLKDTNQEE